MVEEGESVAAAAAAETLVAETEMMNVVEELVQDLVYQNYFRLGHWQRAFHF